MVNKAAIHAAKAAKSNVISLISFVFTALAIWKILLPLLLKGISPIPVSFGVTAIATTIIVLLITGFNKKGWVALSGAITGVGITTVLALLFGGLFKIPGTVQEFSETLLFAGFMNLRLSDIFISCIFISSAGAVMDVAMDIAAEILHTLVGSFGLVMVAPVTAIIGGRVFGSRG